MLVLRKVVRGTKRLTGLTLGWTRGVQNDNSCGFL